MYLQSTFYVIGILYMLLMIIIMVSFIVLAFWVKNKIDRFEQRVNYFLQYAVPATSAVGFGSFIVSKMVDLFTGKRSR